MIVFSGVCVCVYVCGLTSMCDISAGVPLQIHVRRRGDGGVVRLGRRRRGGVIGGVGTRPRDAHIQT